MTNKQFNDEQGKISATIGKLRECSGESKGCLVPGDHIKPPTQQRTHSTPPSHVSAVFGKGVYVCVLYMCVCVRAAFRAQECRVLIFYLSGDRTTKACKGGVVAPFCRPNLTEFAILGVRKVNIAILKTRKCCHSY